MSPAAAAARRERGWNAPLTDVYFCVQLGCDGSPPPRVCGIRMPSPRGLLQTARQKGCLGLALLEAGEGIPAAPASTLLQTHTWGSEEAEARPPRRTGRPPAPVANTGQTGLKKELMFALPPPCHARTCRPLTPPPSYTRQFSARGGKLLVYPESLEAPQPPAVGPVLSPRQSLRAPRWPLLTCSGLPTSRQWRPRLPPAPAPAPAPAAATAIRAVWARGARGGPGRRGRPRGGRGAGRPMGPPRARSAAGCGHPGPAEAGAKGVPWTAGGSEGAGRRAARTARAASARGAGLRCGGARGLGAQSGAAARSPAASAAPAADGSAGAAGGGARGRGQGRWLGFPGTGSRPRPVPPRQRGTRRAQVARVRRPEHPLDGEVPGPEGCGGAPLEKPGS